MRAVIVVCLLAGVALAAPRHKHTALDPTLSDHVRRAESAWTAADGEADPTKQTVLWEAAADAFALVDGDALDAKVKRVAAQSAVLAWKNIIETESLAADRKWVTAREGEPPRPVPAREQKLIAALDRYAKYLAATDPELPPVLFLKARIYGRYDQYDIALPLYRTIIDSHPRHEVAAYAASLLLDAFARLKQYDKLAALATDLAANKAFMQGRDDLSETVREILHQVRRKRAEAIERRAKATRDLAEYEAAAEIYVKLYNDDPGSDHADEVLYNAGVMFEEARSVARAFEMYARVRKQFPRRPLAQRALARSAKLYADIAQYERAADQLEEYAELYARERDARDAQSDAVYYRIRLRQHGKAVAAVDYFEKTFAARDPERAADVKFWLIASYEAEGTLAPLIAYLRQYTKTWAHKGQHENRVIAHAKLGLALWKQSCGAAVHGGLCIKITERARTCETGTTRTFAAVPRNARIVKEASTALTEAIKQFESKKTDDAEARRHYALAKLALADRELEKFIAMPAAANDRLFDDWLMTKLEAVGRIHQGYVDVRFIEVPEAVIVGLERGGLIEEHVWSELVAGRVAKEMRCEMRATHETEAVDFYTQCIAQSSERGWFDATTRCERSLRALRPTAVPTPERRSRSVFTAPLVVSEPPMR